MKLHADRNVAITQRVLTEETLAYAILEDWSP